MTLVYILKLSLKIQITDIGAQKINNSLVKTFKIIINSF